MAVLVDTSVWYPFLKDREPTLARILRDPQGYDELVMHPFVFGELLLAGVSRPVQAELQWVRTAVRLADEDVFDFVRRWRPVGVGWVDAHLLAAAEAQDYVVWTKDEAMRGHARAMGLALFTSR